MKVYADTSVFGGVFDNEPGCVVLKRRGAEYVAEKLKGLTSNEQLEFWRKRSEQLEALQSEVRSRSKRERCLTKR
jgi:hypothetical protein